MNSEVVSASNSIFTLMASIIRSGAVKHRWLRAAGPCFQSLTPPILAWR